MLTKSRKLPESLRKRSKSPRKRSKSPRKRSKSPQKRNKTTKKCTIGSKLRVWRGKCDKTTGGLKKKDLMKNATSGRIISKKRSVKSKNNPWIKAVSKARKFYNITGFAVIGGRTQQGQNLLSKARQIHKQLK